MEEAEKVSENEEPRVPESPKAMAFTIDFNEGKNVNDQRLKSLVEKYQNRHKRGQSLSKFEDAVKLEKKAPLTGNLPRKASFHSEGYFSSDEKDKFKSNGARSSVLNSVILKSDLSLTLRNVNDRMTQSYPNRNFDLPSINSPEIELKDVSSPELDLVSPISPFNETKKAQTTNVSTNSSPESETKANISLIESKDDFQPNLDFDFDKSDAVSDAGTYTLDADNYTEEQKIRMSIDKEFNIEHVSGVKKSQEYIKSLEMSKTNYVMHSSDSFESFKSDTASQKESLKTNEAEPSNVKILYPSAKPWMESESEPNDKGFFTSVSTSGVLSKRAEKRYVRRSSLVQSEIVVEAYTGSSNTISVENSQIIHATYTLPKSQGVKNISDSKSTDTTKVTCLPPPVGGMSGKSSPTKIPSPKHSIVRPRSRNTYNTNMDLSDSSCETESYLKQSENIISSLQARLSLDSDQESDYDKKYKVKLNNDTKSLLKSKPVHVRHNSLDDRNIKLPNKLEHFHNKNFQSIDQTLKTCNQNKTVHRIQNSPNNSPIRRSSSFSVKNQFDSQPKCINTSNKESNVNRHSPVYSNNSIQRSASTASIKPSIEQFRRSSISSDQKSDRSYHYETESSSEDESHKITKNKKDLTNTRYNRAFSLRRARLDTEPPIPKCPNTPEMKRKFMPAEKSERGTSVDRKPVRSEVPSRYLNITKTKPQPKEPPARAPPKTLYKPVTNKPPTFSRTDSGRFSMRTPKPINTPSKSMKKDPNKKQSGPRSNSTLSSREVEFQNWKRRKSYDPMKAAAEGKKKAELTRKQNLNVMTQSYNENSQDYDSSPSHSSSVHRSQSFHGTAALEQLISSEDEDLTFSGEEGFSPPTPSPYEMSPTRSSIRQVWKEPFRSKR